MRVALLIAALVVAGCAASARQSERVAFDFGPLSEGRAAGGVLRAVTVAAPSWLVTPAM